MAKRYRAKMTRCAGRAFRPTALELEARALLSVGPDPTFGVQGTASVRFPDGFPPNGNTAVTQLAGGGIVTVTTDAESDIQYIALAGLPANGLGNNSFGQNGVVFVNAPSPMYDETRQNTGTSVAALPNGRFVVAGSFYPGSNTGDQEYFALYNLDANATEALNKEANLVYSTPQFRYPSSLGGYDAEQANAVAVEGNGNVIAAGFAPDPNNKTADVSQVALVQETTGPGFNGLNEDQGFGQSGLEEIPVPGATSAVADAVAVQNVGGVEMILVAGTALVTGHNEFFVMRVSEANGALDPNFGDNRSGVIVRKFAAGDAYAGAPPGIMPVVSLGVNGASIDLTGQIVLGPGKTQTAVARYTANGAIDTTFGGGTGLLTGVADSGGGVGILPDGSLVDVGVAAGTGIDVLGNAKVLSAGPANSVAVVGVEVTRFTGYPDHFAVSVPATATTGQAAGLTVTALNAVGQQDTSYTGTVHFASSDASAKFPANYTFTAGDGGTHTFASGVTFAQGGLQTVTASAPANDALPATASVQVTAGATAPTLALSATAVNTSYGQPVQFFLTVASSVPGGPTPTGAVQFQVDGNNLKAPVQLVNGVATSPVDSTIPAGTHSILGYYGGDANNTKGGALLTLVVSQPVTQSTGSVSGSVFVDFNVNGVADPGDVGVAGRTVFADLHGDGVDHPDDPSAATDSNGNYTLSNLAPGSYTVRLLAYPGDLVTGPAGGSYAVTVAANQAVTGDGFGIQQVSTLLPLYPSAAPFGANNPDLNTAEVQGLYRLVLGRAPDPGGLAYQVNLLKQGEILAKVAYGFLHAPEYYKDVINGMYSAYLGRAALPTEIASNTTALQGGKTPEQLAVSLLASAESVKLHPDTAVYVQSVYQNILGRSATPAELTAGTNALAAGTSRASLAATVVNSNESDTRVIGNVYSVFFARQPNPGEALYYLQELQAGNPVLIVAPGFLGSVEYNNRARPTVTGH